MPRFQCILRMPFCRGYRDSSAATYVKSRRSGISLRLAFWLVWTIVRIRVQSNWNKPKLDARRAYLAGFLSLVLLFCTWVSSSASLHNFFHSDSAAPTHSCVITDVGQGHSFVGLPPLIETNGTVTVSTLCFQFLEKPFLSSSSGADSCRAPPLPAQA